MLPGFCTGMLLGSVGGGGPPPGGLMFVRTHTEEYSGSAVTSVGFTAAALGAADPDRELVIAVSFSKSAASGSTAASTLHVGAVELTRIASMNWGQSGAGTAGLALFKGNVPTGTADDITVTFAATIPFVRIEVWRGIGTFHLVNMVSTGTTGGGVNILGDGPVFAVSTVENTSDDTSIVGLAAQTTNEEVGAHHRMSVAYDDLAFATHAISSVAATQLAAVSLAHNVPPLNLALVAADTAHASATNTKADLERYGHTVTLIADSAIGSTNFSSYHVVLAIRVTSSSTAVDSTVASGIRALFDGGKPIVVGSFGQSLSAGTGRSTLGTLLRLTGTWRIISSTAGLTDIVIDDNSHAITAGFAEAAMAFYSAANFRGFAEDGQSFVGTELALGVGAGAADSALIAVESGTLDLDAATINARCVVADFHAAQSGHTALGRFLLNRAVQWAAGNIG